MSSLRRATRLSHVDILAGLACASVAFLAVSLYLGAEARIASNVNLPPDATPGSVATLRLSAIIGAAAGIYAIDRLGLRLRLPYLGSVLLLCVALGASEVFLWHESSLSSVSPILSGTVILMTFPVVFRDLSDRHIAFVFSPLMLLCAASVALTVLGDSYLFPWYNRWGLVAVLAAALAVALTGLPDAWRLAALAVAVASVTMSSSRQALLGIMLMAFAWVMQLGGFGPRLRGLLVAAIGGGAVYYAIGASARVEALGGVAGTNGRSELFESAQSAIISSPLAGLAGERGPGAFAESLTAVGLGWSASVHNFILDSWLRGGLVTAIGAVVFLVAVVWPPSRRGRLLGVTLLPFFMLGSELLYFEDMTAALLLALVYGVGMTAGSVLPGRSAGPRSEEGAVDA